MNVMLRMHWTSRAAIQKIWDDWVIVQWYKYDRIMFNKPVRLLYVLHFQKIGVKDLDNYLGGSKFITDALKKTFLVRDDYFWLRSISMDFRKGKESTVVSIEEL